MWKLHDDASKKGNGALRRRHRRRRPGRAELSPGASTLPSRLPSPAGKPEHAIMRASTANHLAHHDTAAARGRRPGTPPPTSSRCNLQHLHDQGPSPASTSPPQTPGPPAAELARMARIRPGQARPHPAPPRLATPARPPRAARSQQRRRARRCRPPPRLSQTASRRRDSPNPRASLRRPERGQVLPPPLRAGFARRRPPATAGEEGTEGEGCLPAGGVAARVAQGRSDAGAVLKHAI
nr:uncharacterized protein LOC127340210 [Lolium perenne]